MCQLVFTWLDPQHEVAALSILCSCILLVFPWLHTRHILTLGGSGGLGRSVKFAQQILWPYICSNCSSYFKLLFNNCLLSCSMLLMICICHPVNWYSYCACRGVTVELTKICLTKMLTITVHCFARRNLCSLIYQYYTLHSFILWMDDPALFADSAISVLPAKD